MIRPTLDEMCYDFDEGPTKRQSALARPSGVMRMEAPRAQNASFDNCPTIRGDRRIKS